MRPAKECNLKKIFLNGIFYDDCKDKDDFGFSMPQPRSLWTWRLLETELQEAENSDSVHKNVHLFLELRYRIFRILGEFSKVLKRVLIFVEDFNFLYSSL